MNDDLFLRAAAYLDGDPEHGFDEHTDQDIAGVVSEIRHLRAQLRDLPPGSDGTRQRMISTAMAEFAPARGRQAQGIGPSRWSHTPPITRVLGVAAATIGVLAVGFVAARSLQRGGEDESFDATTFEVLVGDDGDVERLAEVPAEQAAEESLQIDASEEASSAPMADSMLIAEAPADEPAEAAAAADEPAEKPAGEPAEEPAEEPADETMPAGTALVDPPVVVSGQVLTSPEELGVLGATLLGQSKAGVLPPTPNTRCPVSDVLGRAMYRAGEVVFDVLVAVDEGNGLVSAVDADSCELVADGPLLQPGP